MFPMLIPCYAGFSFFSPSFISFKWVKPLRHVTKIRQDNFTGNIVILNLKLKVFFLAYRKPSTCEEDSARGRAKKLSRNTNVLKIQFSKCKHCSLFTSTHLPHTNTGYCASALGDHGWSSKISPAIEQINT